MEDSKLKSERVKIGLSVMDVCARMYKAGNKVTPPTLASWERDPDLPRLRDLKALARVYGVEVEKLIHK